MSSVFSHGAKLSGTAKNYFEQKWYLLPTGVAIGAEGLLSALTDLVVTPAVVGRSG